MPLVRVAVRQGNTEAYRAAIEEGIHRAMVETIDVPPDDRFQIWSQHSPTELIFDGSYLGIERGEGFLVIQIFLNSGRSLEKKRALYRKIADNLARDPGIRPQDVLVNLVEVTKENWSFGNGDVSYAKETPA